MRKYLIIMTDRIIFFLKVGETGFHIQEISNLNSAKHLRKTASRDPNRTCINVVVVVNLILYIL